MSASLIFIGVLVSLIVQFGKKKTGTGTLGTLGIVVGLSLVGAVGYSVLAHYGWLDATVQVLATAGAFYAFIIKNVQDLSGA